MLDEVARLTTKHARNRHEVANIDGLLDSLVVSISHPGHLDILPDDVSWVEYRADILGDEPRLGMSFDHRRSLYALRSRTAGGQGASIHPERGGRLVRAAARHDLVELEFPDDLQPLVLDSIPADKRLIAWYGPARSTAALHALVADMARVPASLYRVVPHARRPDDGISPLSLRRSLGREDVVAYASGAPGVWTQFLGAGQGSPMFCSDLHADRDGPARPDRLPLYRLLTARPRLHSVIDSLFGIVGSTVEHSLSPLLHNWMYRASALPHMYVPFAVGDLRNLDWLPRFAEAIDECLGLPVSGVTVMAPYKEAALHLVVPSRRSLLAQRAGAANLLLRRNGHWYAHTTDVHGIMAPIRDHRADLSGCRAVVIGCGGAGRAAVVGLLRAGARVTLVNRERERGQLAAQFLNVPFSPLSRIALENADITINATPVGRHDDRMPFDVNALRPDSLLVDLVYRADTHTQLIRHARTLGLDTVGGRDILHAEVCKQFEMMTSHPAPEMDISSLLLLR